ncbi:MAG: Thermostable beta-glucosidase B [Candidatus Heimdallarchaeota archaeon LC_3]|nr:MAG: Thermostable beta-glucosidase B [Candidatus Heimdallarchaeota archaeon LC_3]
MIKKNNSQYSIIDLDDKVNNLLSKLTIKEKFMLLSGHRLFQTNSIKRLGIKPFKMTDGPFGISMHSSRLRKNTKFPAGINLAATWNRELASEYGIAIGKEARAAGRLCVLSPGINIDRSPLNGRTFEYFSEDPYLTKEIAIPYVKAVQNQRIAACLKHYVANNQETNRYLVSAEISERALYEIYLKAFEEVTREADPWTLMTSYNKVNSLYANEDTQLLKETLDKWGFNGFVMSDWWATSNGKRKPNENPSISPEQAFESGLSLEMPRAYVYDEKRLRKAYNDGIVTEKEINSGVGKFLRVLHFVGMFEEKKELPKGERNTPLHQKLARSMSEEGMVLLKNEGNILPLEFNKINKIAILGPNSNKKFGKMLYGGSSAVKPPYEITPLQGLKEKFRGEINIVNNPENADCVLLFMGLNHDSSISLTRGTDKSDKINYGNDAEGTDRGSLSLPIDQIDLINETVKINPNTVVVLINGSPIGMDEWLEKVPVVLEAWYPGMEGGRAIANVLFGDVNPSGKLPITFPKLIDDSPAHFSEKTYPGENNKVFYKEGIYIGYRHYEKNNITPLFPFGFGLSYTDFSYGDIIIENNSLSSINDNFKVKINVQNMGNKTGAEIIQVYARDIESSVDRPLKELIGFEKVLLKPNEEKTVDLCIKAKDLAFYDIKTKNWVIEDGIFDILVNSSINDNKLKSELKFHNH